MPRFYFKIKNILRRIKCVWVGVCVCVCDTERERERGEREREREKEGERLMKERKTELNFRNHAIKSFSSSFIYLFLMPV